MKFFKNKDSEEINEISSENSEVLPQKKFPWHIVNFLVVISIFMGGCFLLIFAYNLTFYMVWADIFINIFLVFFYRIWLKKGKFRKTVIALRFTAVFAVLITFAIPLSLINFTYSKAMYKVKKFVYCNGVYSDYDIYLPEKLPKVCNDYKFFTQGSFPAQDYHPSAYLIFHTDTETMQRLENSYKSLKDAELIEIEQLDIGEYKREYGDRYEEYLPEYPKQFPGHVYCRLDDKHIDDFFDVVIYEIPSYYSKGCIFDYSSGLVVYWT